MIPDISFTSSALVALHCSFFAGVVLFSCVPWSFVYSGQTHSLTKENTEYFDCFCSLRHIYCGSFSFVISIIQLSCSCGGYSLLLGFLLPKNKVCSNELI
jgi:hypothetical protein